MSVAGAIRIEEMRDDVPEVVRELLNSGEIQWESGARFGVLSATQPKIRGAKKLVPLPPREPAKSACAPPPSTFRFAELFAGIGGFRLGLEALGGECVFASECDAYAAATYESNFGEPPSAGDITEVGNGELPPHDLLVGGFPCQPFSVAGSQPGLADARGQLYLEICRVLHACRPAAFLLENVPGLYTLDGGSWQRGGESQPGAVYQTIADALGACGYTVSSRIVGSDAFGLPQQRNRLYIVGFADAATAARFSWPARALWPDAKELEGEMDGELEGNGSGGSDGGGGGDGSGGGDGGGGGDGSGGSGGRLIADSTVRSVLEPASSIAVESSQVKSSDAKSSQVNSTVRSVLEPAGSLAVESAMLTSEQYAKVACLELT